MSDAARALRRGANEGDESLGAFGAKGSLGGFAFEEFREGGSRARREGLGRVVGKRDADPFACARAFGRGIPGVHVRPERVTLVGHEFGGKVVGEVAVEVERALAREAEGGHGGERSGGGAHVEDGGARVGDHGRGGRGRIGGVVLPRMSWPNARAYAKGSAS